MKSFRAEHCIVVLQYSPTPYDTCTCVCYRYVSVFLYSSTSTCTPILNIYMHKIHGHIFWLYSMT